MPEHNRKPLRPNCIVNILVILVMIIVTISLSILFIRFGPKIYNSLVLVDTENHSTDGGQKTLNYDNFFMVTIPTTPTNFTIGPGANKLVNMSTINLDPSPTVVGGKELKKSSTTSLLEVTSRSGSNIVQNFETRSSVTKRTVLPLKIKDNLTNQNLQPVHLHRFNSTTIDGNNNRGNDTMDIEINWATNRQIKNNKMDTLHEERETLKAQEISPYNYHNSYDSPYNLGDYGDKKKENQMVGNRWASVNNPAGSYLDSFWPSESNNNLEHEIRERYPTEHEHDYTIGPSNYYPKPMSSKEHKIDWNKIGILAFIKLSLFKLQAIGFQKILFLLVFKLKMFMAAIFFKFLLIVKLMKFFNILILPLFILQLLPSIWQILRMRPTSIPTLQENAQPTLLASTALPILSSGGLTGGSASSGSGGTLLPGVTTNTLIPGGMTINGNRLPNGITNTLVPSSNTGNRLPTGQGFSSFKLDDLNINNEQQKEPLELFDPTLDIFEKLLDSEKCVERIACRMAVAEKAGIMPLWISWILQRVSNFIPNEKLETYLKTYDDVNNVIYSKSAVPENWAIWCSEQYGCNK